MVRFTIYVEKGDVVGDGRGKPYREFVVSYRKIRRSSDLGLGTTKHSSTGSKTVAIREARKLARKLSKEGSVTIRVSDCGKPHNGTYAYAEGKFWREA
jgi:hypothetical protein